MRDLLQTQLAYTPVVEGGAQGTDTKSQSVVCGGMGGSAFPARLIRFLGATPYVISHRDYGLPANTPDDAHYIAISYSGNTEETLSFAQEALAKGLPLSVIASGGELLTFAKEHELSYVEVPNGFVPRDAIIFMTKALLALIGEESLFAKGELSALFDVDAAEREGESLAQVLENAVPIIYASERNEMLPGFAKALFNETAKIPAFANVFPELDHNELQGFDVTPDTRSLVDPLMAVFLRDDSDDARIKRRMELTEQLLASKGVRTLQVSLPHDTRTNTFLYTWWLMRTAAHNLATQYDVDPDATPLIDRLKEAL